MAILKKKIVKTLNKTRLIVFAIIVITLYFYRYTII